MRACPAHPGTQQHAYLTQSRNIRNLLGNALSLTTHLHPRGYQLGVNHHAPH